MTIGGDVLGLEQWIGARRETAGAYLREFGQNRVLLLAEGRRPTGGFEVRVTSVRLRQGSYEVSYTLRGPRRGAAVTQAETFPTAHVRLPADGRPVRVLRRDGRAREVPVTLDDGTVSNEWFRVTTPLIGDLIASPVLVRGQARVFEATFNVTVADGVAQLAEVTVTALEAGPAWGDFEARITFTAPTTPAGSLLFWFIDADTGQRRGELALPVRFSR